MVFSKNPNESLLLFIFLIFFFLQKHPGLQKICSKLYSNMFPHFVHLLCLKVHVFSQWQKFRAYFSVFEGTCLKVHVCSSSLLLL